MKEPITLSHAQEVFNEIFGVRVVYKCTSRQNYDIYIVTNLNGCYYAYIDIPDMDIVLESSEEVFVEFESFFPRLVDVSLIYGYGCFFHAHSTTEDMIEQMFNVSQKTAELKTRLIRN